MKRLFIIITPALLLTILFVSKPPRHADGQPFRLPPVTQDTALRIPDSGVADFKRTVDSVNKNAVLLKVKASESLQLSEKIERGTRKLLKEAKKEKGDSSQGVVVFVKDTDTIVLKDTAIVYVNNNRIDNRTWWAKYRSLLRQCTIKRDVKKFTSKIFRHGKSQLR